MSGRNRAAAGGLIDRDRPIAFRFDGKSYYGFAGDTLASALLANGVTLLGRSFKYHRPRGLLAAGAEEPNALVTIGSGASAEPNARATMVELYAGLEARSQNAWPSRNFDLGAVNGLFAPLFPSGFYYKTFIGGPRGAWTKLYEPLIRRMAGLGTAPTEADPDSYDKRHANCDTLVVGAGVAGLAAALAASDIGERVILVDENARPGGYANAALAPILGTPGWRWASEAAREFASRSDCRFLTRTTAFGRYDHGLVMAVERRGDHLAAFDGPRQRLWQIRAKRIILATGAHQQPLLFGNNDLPGVMLAHAGQVFARHYAALAGRRVLVATVDDSGYVAAAAMAEAGAEIVAIVDSRMAARGNAPLRSDHPHFPGAVIVRACGRRRVSGAEIADGDGARHYLDCDALLMSGGWQPALHLHSHVGGKARYDAQAGCFVPIPLSDGVVSVGSCAGAFALDRCLEQGGSAGRNGTATQTIFAPPPPKQDWRKVEPPAADNDAATGAEASAAQFTPPTKGKAFIDFQNDVTAADIDLAAREGFVSVEHLKRYTTTGMATDQGKTSNLNALKRMGDQCGVGPGTVGTTTFRPPYTPVTFGALAGIDVGNFSDPVRNTPIHDWHVAQGARFENVGQWQRAWYYPRFAETMESAVRRECLAVRQRVGLFDASTLGKIDIQGPDAATFLNLVYTNAWSKLAVGRCRYGIMLRDDGMVFDDGVTIRTHEHRFLMTTTTGNAAAVLDHLEDLLQTEWPHLKVYLTSVTEHWAACVVTGPRARALLETCAQEIDLSDEAFPHLSMREAMIGGIGVRLYRISFTGELSYEVHVPAQHGRSIWETLYSAGLPFGLMPYGTEAMHVLRAEKGFIIIGQETDGSVTPIDLGLDWAIAKSKVDFIGQRSLLRSALTAPGRKQLVGLRPLDQRTVVDEGAQIMTMSAGSADASQGHVTSSYWSDACGGPIALALLESGRERHGEVVRARWEDRSVACEICPPLFYDPEGARLNA